MSSTQMERTTTQERQRTRPPVGARRFGYAVAIGVNALLLFLINQAPGWQVLPFLTADMEQVLGFVNASLIAAVVANSVYVLADPRWLRALGDVVTTTFGLVAMVQFWWVWPLDFGDSAFDWEVVARVFLVIGIVGSVFGIIVALVNLSRELLRR